MNQKVRLICDNCDGDGEIFRAWKYWIEAILTTGIRPEIMRLRNKFHACYTQTCKECKGIGHVEKDWNGDRDWQADDSWVGYWI